MEEAKEEKKRIYNYNKLRGRIVEKLGTLTKFAEELGISCNSLNQKLSSKVYFKQSEISTSCEILDIPETEIKVYFFSEQSCEKHN